MDDRELLARIRQGDEEAFDTLFRSSYASLVRMAEGMVRLQAVAEEIVQDVLLELWRRREKLAPEGSVQAYLFQATRNRARNYLRHARVEQRGEPQLIRATSSPPAADEDLTHEEMDAAFRRALDALPERCREVFNMSRVHALRYHEIARGLGVSVKTVEADMSKALRTLRAHLAPWLPQGGDKLP